MGINYNSNYDEILKKIKEEGAADLNKSLADNDATHNLQKQTVTDNYNAQLKDTESTYADDYRANAVQKLINEREVAESMADLGLTDSGLNRTQQTAVQLSYANKNADIDRQKRSMVDSLKLQLNNSLNEIETSRISNASAINQTYESAWADSAQKVYNDNLDYLEEVRKEQIAAAKEAAESKLLYTYQGNENDADNNNYKLFLDNNGKVRKVSAGVNPYTGDNNKKIYFAESKDIGFFSNGYQPKGLVSEGGKFSKATDESGNILQTDYTGKLQTIWKAPNGKYFVWRGDLNQYEEVQM